MALPQDEDEEGHEHRNRISSGAEEEQSRRSSDRSFSAEPQTCTGGDDTPLAGARALQQSGKDRSPSVPMDGRRGTVPPNSVEQDGDGLLNNDAVRPHIRHERPSAEDGGPATTTGGDHRPLDGLTRSNLEVQPLRRNPVCFRSFFSSTEGTQRSGLYSSKSPRRPCRAVHVLAAPFMLSLG